MTPPSEMDYQDGYHIELAKNQKLTAANRQLKEQVEVLDELHKHDHEGITAYSNALFGRPDMGHTDGVREISELMKDKERLDWLDHNPMTYEKGCSRQAIDAAIAREVKQS